MTRWSGESSTEAKLMDYTESNKENEKKNRMVLIQKINEGWR